MSLVRVDDADSAFEYTGGWQRADGTNEFLGGAHGSRWQGDTADYTFSGTSIAVFGTLGNNPTTEIVSTYSIDGTRAGTYVQPHNGSTSYRQQMFRSGQLSPGEHTLHVRLDSQDAWYWLDYVEYTALAAAAPSSSGSPTPTVAPVPSSSKNSEPSSSTSPSSTPPSSTPVVTSVSSSMASTSTFASILSSASSANVKPSTFPSTSTTGAASINTSATSAPASTGLSSKDIQRIIGGSIGGGIVLVAFILLLVWNRRHRDERGERDMSPFYTHYNESQLPQAGGVSYSKVPVPASPYGLPTSPGPTTQFPGSLQVQQNAHPWNGDGTASSPDTNDNRDVPPPAYGKGMSIV